MTAVEIREALLEIIADIIPDQDLGLLNDDVPLRDQLALDSMDFLDIVMQLRKCYRVRIPEEDYPMLSSIQNSVEYLEPLLKDIAK